MLPIIRLTGDCLLSNFTSKTQQKQQQTNIITINRDLGKKTKQQQINIITTNRNLRLGMFHYVGGIGTGIVKKIGTGKKIWNRYRKKVSEPVPLIFVANILEFRKLLPKPFLEELLQEKRELLPCGNFPCCCSPLYNRCQNFHLNFTNHHHYHNHHHHHHHHQ